MGEEFTTKTAENLTDDDIYILLTPADKEALAMGKKLKDSKMRKRYIKYSIVLVLTAIAITAVICKIFYL